jgi:hypothetical protein
MCGIESDKLDAALCSKPDSGIVGGRARDDVYFGGGDLFGSLSCVPPIRKETRGAARNCECSTRSSESAEIPNVGEVGDKEAVQACASDATSYQTDTAVMVHSGQDKSGTKGLREQAGFGLAGGPFVFGHRFADVDESGREVSEIADLSGYLCVTDCNS